MERSSPTRPPEPSLLKINIVIIISDGAEFTCNDHLSWTPACAGTPTPSNADDNDDDIDDDREIYLGAPASLDRISIFHARLNSGDGVETTTRHENSKTQLCKTVSTNGQLEQLLPNIHCSRQQPSWKRAIQGLKWKQHLPNFISLKHVNMRGPSSVTKYPANRPASEINADGLSLFSR